MSHRHSEVTQGREGVVAAVLGVLALVGTGIAATATPSAPPEPFVVIAAVPPPTSAAATATAAPSARATPVGNPLATAAADPVAAATTEPFPRVSQAYDGWVQSTAAATGIPPRSLLAYGNATLALADEQPSCRLGWATLAGIGQIESGHGRAGLRDDGLPAEPIVGPALDGRPGVAAIRATPESTAWHGDPVWDHAVGPMQFIPSTWRTWAADGDRDGVANPQDIDDAALAAARYLCAGSRDLSTGEGWWAAVLSYNHSDAYVEKVFAAADRYAAAAQ